MTILDELAAHARTRVEEDIQHICREEMSELARAVKRSSGEAFTAALKKPGMSFICEVKRASPSKGLIAPDFPYVDIARDYELAGADAVSCLTEPKWFLGSDEIFREIRSNITLPMIRKDFTVDPYQIDQAAVMGANAVLLICSILDTDAIAKALEQCDELGLAALVETHSDEEIRSAVSAGARIIGVNNRNLKNFTVDFSLAAKLRDLIPPEAIYVAESGVRSPSDAAVLRSIGADAALIGEALMRSSDRAQMIKELKEAAK